jgi:hypothetical protein
VYGKILCLAVTALLMLVHCKNPTSRTNDGDPLTSTVFTVTFLEETYTSMVNCGKSCTTIVANGGDVSGYMVSACAYGNGSGGYSSHSNNASVAFTFGVSNPLSSTYPTGFRSGKFFFDVLDSIVWSKAYSEYDTFTHIDSVSRDVSVTIQMGNGRMSGSISGSLGEDNPENMGKNKRLERPLNQGITGSFDGPMTLNLDCDGN